MPTWPVAAGSFIVGFAVADWSGVRPLGGIVLLTAAAWCFVRWSEAHGVARAIALLAFGGAAFAVSHILADPLGTWGAVFTVSALAGAAAWIFGDAGSRRPRRF
jgi:thiol:disulfide interchange protein